MLMQIKQIKGNTTIIITWSPLDKVSKMKWLQLNDLGWTNLKDLVTADLLPSRGGGGVVYF